MTSYDIKIILSVTIKINHPMIFIINKFYCNFKNLIQNKSEKNNLLKKLYYLTQEEILPRINKLSFQNTVTFLNKTHSMLIIKLLKKLVKNN